jgi:hypothetical protein
VTLSLIDQALGELFRVWAEHFATDLRLLVEPALSGYVQAGFHTLEPNELIAAHQLHLSSTLCILL